MKHTGFLPDTEISGTRGTTIRCTKYTTKWKSLLTYAVEGLVQGTFRTRYRIRAYEVTGQSQSRGVINSKARCL